MALPLQRLQSQRYNRRMGHAKGRLDIMRLYAQAQGL
jgi:hypothetical protein